MTNNTKPKDPAQEILEGLGKLAKAFVKGASRKKRPAPGGFTGINPPAPPKSGCGGCGR